MTITAERESAARFADWPLALKSILGFWLFYALTIVARAFLGSDPLTMLSNRMLTILAGVLLTGLVYLVIAGFTRGASIRKKAVVAAIASFAASWGMATSFFVTEKIMREPKEVFRYQSREGFVITEKGRTLTVERRAQEPLVVTWPKMTDLDANKRLRYAADASVTWLFFFLAWSAFYLATKSQAEVLNARRRAAEAETAAQAAQWGNNFTVTWRPQMSDDSEKQAKLDFEVDVHEETPFISSKNSVPRPAEMPKANAANVT